jgi:hypothetical protein
LDDFLSNPAVQGGIAPFVAGLVVALALQPFRLGGLAIIAAFLTCVYFVSGLQFTPLTATRKIVLLSIAAPVIGWAVDHAFKATRPAIALLGMAVAVAVLWVFWSVIAGKPAPEAWLLGVTAALSVAFMVAFAQTQLAQDGVRAGAAALAVGLGVGIAAIFSASASYGLYGISLAAGAGAFLLPQMVRGKKGFAGSTFTLPAMLVGGLVAAGTMVLAKLPWYSMLMLALVPLGARLPVPQRAPVWGQAVLCSLYSFIIAGAACALAWPSSHQQ